jgi:hypothetical protein
MGMATISFAASSTTATVRFLVAEHQADGAAQLCVVNGLPGLQVGSDDAPRKVADQFAEFDPVMDV